MVNLTRSTLWQTVLAAVLVASLAVAGWYYYHITHRIIWSMIHVSGNASSGDAHVLEFPDGRTILIDTGFDRFTRSNLIPYLEQRHINRIDALIVTHAHRNHYGGIGSLLEYRNGVERVYFNLPPKTRCDRETWSTGCDYRHVLATRQLIHDAGIPLESMVRDDVLYRDEERDIALEVVYAHDGESRPIGDTGINDTSALLRLTYGATSVFFTGDVNRKVGKYLVENDFPLKAPIMTAPHHGVDSAASNDFLRKVGAEVLMVSNSRKHWQGERGARMRQFAKKSDMRAYVTGLHGNVIVTLMPNKYTIDTQLNPST